MGGVGGGGVQAWSGNVSIIDSESMRTCMARLVCTYLALHIIQGCSHVHVLMFRYKLTCTYHVVKSIVHLDLHSGQHQY